MTVLYYILSVKFYAHINLIYKCFYFRSEANDLALRLAQDYTENQDVIVQDQ